MARKDELGKDAEGRYRRYIGWKWGNGRPIQHLFRLGKDEDAAKAANRRLEQLWDAVVARWKRQKAEGTTDEAAPVWDDITLTTKTTGGNENQVIKNHWDNLMKRLVADIPGFHVLPPSSTFGRRRGPWFAI